MIGQIYHLDIPVMQCTRTLVSGRLAESAWKQTAFISLAACFVLHPAAMAAASAAHAGSCSPRKSPHSWKSAGTVLALWYVKEFLYRLGTDGTTCSKAPRDKMTGPAQCALSRQVRVAL